MWFEKDQHPEKLGPLLPMGFKGNSKQKSTVEAKSYGALSRVITGVMLWLMVS